MHETGNDLSDEATEAHDGAGIYQIRVRGHLDDRWSARFEGRTITREANGDTLLTGPVDDQAALHGLLRTVRDLGLPLLSVIRVEAGEGEATIDTKQG